MNLLCTHCGFQNPPGMRFCGNCGSRLPLGRFTGPLSPAVPASVDTGQLGVMMGADLLERLQKAGIEAAGQRRSVTVLFTDLTGYTQLSEQTDSEDLYDLIQQYIRLLLHDVYKYEGIVDKLTGDGLMALFGAPIAHENNAERAVRAALDMQADVAQLSREMKEKIGVELGMRVGLHSGSVVVGGVGSNLMMDYTAIGDTVNQARRIEEAATAGAVLISESVYRQTRALFDCQQANILNAKGITHPIAAYRVLGVKATPGTLRGLEGLRAPMIGRDAEMAQLQASLSGLLNRKQGQFVLVTGEAGLGKSRLTAEFRLSLRGYPLRVLTGQSLAYRRSVSYWVFLDLIYGYLGLAPNSPPPQVRERLIQSVYQALGSQAADVLPFFEQLLSLPYSDLQAADRLRYLDAGQLRQQIFLALRDLLLAEARKRPLLIILEDLHWADAASLELLLYLLESLRQAPIFILGISRQVDPGPMAKAVEWGQQNLGERFRLVPLQNLSLDESERLLYLLLTIPSLPEKLREQILLKSAGIPFYLEEILRMLIDEGVLQRAGEHWQVVPGAEVAALGVPETLQGLILARFDRLDSAQRRVLQVASVIGKDFSLGVLNTVLGALDANEIHPALDSLAEREFIQPRPEDPDNEYTFRHILMSDAIYSTLLRRERAKLHGQVGDAIETLYADRLEGQIELLANHYRWSPQLDRALHYLILSGQKAARNNINEQARAHYETALELLPQVAHLPAQALQVEMGLGDTLVFAGEYPAARLHYQTGLDAIAGKDTRLYGDERSTLFRKIAKTFERQGDYDEALSYLAKAQEALDCAPLPLPEERAQVWNDIGLIHFRRGNFPEAQQLLQQALDLVEGTAAFDTVASIYNRLGGVAYNQGDWDRAAGFIRKSIAIRESIHDVVGLASSFSNLGYLEIEMGEFDNALENLTRSYELKTRLGQAEGIAVTLNNLGWLRILRGELDEAGQAIEQALELARQIGYSSLLWQLMKNTGELRLAARDWEPARQALAEVAAALQELGAQDQLLDTYRLLGEAALGAENLPAAKEWARKALALVESLGSEAEALSTVQRGELRRFLGMLAIQARDWPRAAQYLHEGERIFQKLRSRLYQGRIAYQLGALAEAQGDGRGAGLCYREAVLLFQSIGARLEEQRAEEARARQLTVR